MAVTRLRSTTPTTFACRWDSVRVVLEEHAASLQQFWCRSARDQIGDDRTGDDALLLVRTDAGERLGLRAGVHVASVAAQGGRMSHGSLLPGLINHPVVRPSTGYRHAGNDLPAVQSIVRSCNVDATSEARSPRP